MMLSPNIQGKGESGDQKVRKKRQLTKASCQDNCFPFQRSDHFHSTMRTKIYLHLYGNIITANMISHSLDVNPITLF